MSFIVRFLKRIDFLGSNYGFENDSSIQYKSVQGAIFSLIVIIAVLVVVLLFGREIYERKVQTFL